MTTKQWSKQCLKDLPQYEYKPWSAVPSMRESKAGKSPSIHMPKSCSTCSKDAQEMGQAVLSSQFVGGLIPEIKSKIAYLEGVSFSELWQKTRFEEAHLRDLESATFTNPVLTKYFCGSGIPELT